MNTKIAPTKIGSRELVRNLKKIKTAVAQGEAFDVQDHGVTAFHIIPPATKKAKKYSFEEFMNFRVNIDRTDLSMNVDKYVYGEI